MQAVKLAGALAGDAAQRPGARAELAYGVGLMTSLRFGADGVRCKIVLA
jgi:hypothetical protein